MLHRSGLLRQAGLSKEDLERLVEIPPDPKMGDFAFPCFSLSKALRKAPNIIASELAAQVSPEGIISRVEAMGPYLNFFADRARVTEKAVGAVLSKGAEYGRGRPKKEKVMIEYSQANTHKAFHVGHLRGTSIGESLARILKFSGYSVLQVNYQGDTGAHVAKWLWCYLKNHKGEKPPKGGKGKWVANIYVEAVKLLAESPAFSDEVNKVNYSLEHGDDKELVKLWKESRKWSLDEFDGIYKDLGAHFDHFFFEREMEKPGEQIVRQMLKDGVAQESEGAIIMDLEECKLGKWVLLRKDGTTLYSAKDLALADKKFREFHIDRSIYVVGNAQSLHLQQLFRTLELIGFKQAKDCHHLSFEEVRLPSGKMSSRTGVNILYSEMKAEIFDYTSEETRKRHPDWSAAKLEKAVRGIAVAALKFDMLKIDHNKPIVFDTKQACDFEGETGPYVQYAHARICSIFRQAGKWKAKEGFKPHYSNEKEFELAKLLSGYPEIVAESAEKYDPAIVARYALKVAQTFSGFYTECPVLKADEKERESRLMLSEAARMVLEGALGLLGIDAPEEM